MIYLDYAANTPVDKEVLECFCEESLKYPGNPNSMHQWGNQAKSRMDEITSKISDFFGLKSSEIIYTSGASESNNLAIKGIANAYRQKGKHIISTCLEHPSVSGALTALQNQGYEIDLIDITSDGRVDLCHLRELLRQDTILVSVSYVDSELGVVQPIEEIGEIIKEYPNSYFHVDGTQAVGKIPVCVKNVDCLSFAPHKFYGINGCGILLKKEGVVLEPLIHGGTSTTIYRSGTPALGLAVSVWKALSLAMTHKEERFVKVSRLNQRLRDGLAMYSLITINSTEFSTPFILNLSVKGVKSAIFQKLLDERDICVSAKSACSALNTASRPVYAVSRDKKNAMSSWRISLSHLTTEAEIEEFLEVFGRCYEQLTNN